MNILFVADILDADWGSACIVNQNFIHACRGHKMSLVCSTVYDHSFGNNFFEELVLVEEKYFKGEESLLYEKMRLKKLYKFLSGFGPRHYKLRRAFKKAVAGVIATQKPDLVYVLGTGIDGPHYYAVMNVCGSIPWAVNIHDPYPVALYPPPYFYKWTREQLQQQQMFQRLISAATFLTFPSLLLQQLMEKHYKHVREKSYVIPHLPHRSMVKYQVETAATVANTVTCTMLHAGALHGVRNPAALINAFQKLRGELSIHPRLVFTGARYGDSDAQRAAWAEEQIIINQKRVTYLESLQEIKAADVLVILEGDNPESPFLPGKVPDYVYANKPVLLLTGAKSEIMRIFGSNYPYTASPADEAAIEKALRMLLSDIANHKAVLPGGELLAYFDAQRNTATKAFFAAATQAIQKNAPASGK